MTTIEVGAHLIVPRKVFLGGIFRLYTHHGIYVGNDKVIHYSGFSDKLSAGPVEITTLDSFRGDYAYSVHPYKNPKYTGQHVVERALSRLGENSYDLQGNNCEHFCTWAVTGRPNSRQVDGYEDIFDTIIPSVSLISLIRARKHSKQGSDAVDIAKDAGVKVAVFAAVPVALPVYAAYKAIKWLFK